MARQIVVELVGDNKKLVKSLDDATSRTGKFNGALKGMAIGAGIGAFNLLTDAVGGTVDFLKEADKAFQEDAASQDKLKASLKANVAAWDGHTDAIERVISSQMRLGFGDEEQRDSLANLVGITHDVTKAQKLQAEAMDLARLKGMSLQSASDLIGKVYGGNLGTLSRYGIVLGKNATSEEALATIQKMAAGQAEAFAKGPLGVQEAAQIKIGESMEQIGSVVNKVSSVAMPLLADALSNTITWLGNTWNAIQPVITTISTALTPVVQSLAPVFESVFTNIQSIVSSVVTIITDLWNTFGDTILTYIQNTLAVVADVFKNTFAIIQGIFDVFAGIFSGDWNKVWEGIKGILKGAWGVITDIVKQALFNLIPFIVGMFAKLPGAIWDVIVSIPGKIGQIWHLITTDPAVRSGLLSALTAPFKLLIDFFTGLPGKVADIFRDVWDGIPKAFKAAINKIIGWWNGLRFGIPRITIPNPLGGNLLDVGGGYATTPQIPYLHQGGIVPGTPGSDVPAILQAGERVIPRSGAGRGGDINIHIDSFIGTDRDIDRLAERVARRIAVAGA